MSASALPGQRLYASVFFFNDTATTEIYTLSLHDALPISEVRDYKPTSGTASGRAFARQEFALATPHRPGPRPTPPRSEEHTSELQSRQYLVCRLLLEKKKSKNLTDLHVYPHLASPLYTHF